MSAAFLQRLMAENKSARESAEALTSRAVLAISKGDRDELSNILRDAGLSESGEEGSAKPVETGNADGTAGVQGSEPPPA